VSQGASQQTPANPHPDGLLAKYPANFGSESPFPACERSYCQRRAGLRAEAGLLTNDSMIVACMRENGLSFLAGNDADFERVRKFTVFKPTDLP
jgi:predicted nucleic acid-binding protein